MGINISVQYNSGFLPDIILLTQSYLRGTLFDGVLHCFWVVFTVFLVSLHGE